MREDTLTQDIHDHVYTGGTHVTTGGMYNDRPQFICSRQYLVSCYSTSQVQLNDLKNCKSIWT